MQQIIYQDNSSVVYNSITNNTLENPKRNYYIYFRDIDYDSDDSSEEYLVGDKLIQYTPKVINIDRIQNMYYEFQGHERLNSMGDIDHEHFKFPASSDTLEKLKEPDKHNSFNSQAT